MRGPLCLFCLCQGGSAAHQGITNGQDAEGPLSLVWEWLAVCSAMVVALVLALAMKLLTQKQRRTSKVKGPGLEAVPGAPFGYRVGEAVQIILQRDALVASDKLKTHLLQTFSRMEQELVKLMTLVRNQRAGLITRHRSCKSPTCQRVRENNKAFNLAVYDIVEE